MDFAQRELRKQGVRLRLAEQPFAILGMLTERAGEIVTREELRLRLWPADTFVDFENGLNNAVKRLRNAWGMRRKIPGTLRPCRSAGIGLLPRDGGGGEERERGDGACGGLRRERRGSSWRGWATGGPCHGAPSAAVAAKSKWRVAGAVAALVVITGVAGGYWFRRSTAFSFTAKDTVVLADFQNSTGETVFDDALRQAS